MLIGVLSIDERGEIGDEMYEMRWIRMGRHVLHLIRGYSTIVLDIESRHQ